MIKSPVVNNFFDLANIKGPQEFKRDKTRKSITRGKSIKEMRNKSFKKKSIRIKNVENDENVEEG